MAELDHLCTQLQATTGTGREIDRPHRYLRGQAQRVGGGGAVRHDDVSTLIRKALDHLDGRRCADAIAAFDGHDIDPAAGAQQGSTLHQAGEHLIYGCAAAQMQQFLGDQRCPFGQAGAVLQDLLRKGLHRDSSNLSEAYRYF